MISEHSFFRDNEAEGDILTMGLDKKVYKSRGTRISPHVKAADTFLDYFVEDSVTFNEESLDVSNKWAEKFNFDSSFSLSKEFEFKSDSFNKEIGSTPPLKEQYKFHIGSQTSSSTDASVESNLASPTKGNFDDIGVDGLRSNLVALNLNVDNHISHCRASFPRFEYNLSGTTSMTPNPRTEYQSPLDTYSEDQSSHNSYNLKVPASRLHSKLSFDDPEPGNTYEVPASMRSDKNDLYSNQQHFVPSNFANMQPMQQIILPNGMPAMVVPMYNFNQERKYRAMGKYNKYGSGESNQANFSKTTFKKKSFKKLSSSIPVDEPLSSFSNRFLELSKDQNGCRYLQSKLANEKGALTKILSELEPHVQELMIDPFGNYLFQKVIERVSEEKRFQLLLKVRPLIIEAALNLHGTRSVQKFVELCTDCEDQSEVLVNCFHGHITKLSMDTNGNHVVQRCLQYFTPNQRKLIYDAVTKDFLLITKHRHGCCVFQRCLDAANKEQKCRFIALVIKHAYQLVKDPFGNYVVQYVLDHCTPTETENLIEALLGKLPELSMQKFSSNVIEKCLMLASDKMKGSIVEEITNTPKLKLLLLDQYANYVIQRALSLGSHENALKLVMKVIPHLSELSHNPTCARRVAGKALKRFPHLYSDSRLAIHASGSGQE